MELGYSTMNNDTGMLTQRLAVALEERGFERLWIGDHTHTPAGSVPPYGQTGTLAETYKRMMDPWVTLGAAAAATTTLQVGTGVLLVNQRDPFTMAKAIASLDVVSEGRVVIGVGVGWNQEEYENHTSVPWSHRYRLMRDRVATIRALWASEEASYSSEYISFGPVLSFPKPLQAPHPPFLVGSLGPLGIAHAVEWADGWAPLCMDFNHFNTAYDELKAHAAKVGRDLTDFRVLAAVRGTPDLAELERFRDLGIESVRLGGEPTMPEDESFVLKRMDSYAELIPKLK